ncbi:MAG TPA: SprT family zinc-dependent metalloprotease [Verrucomicrobiae bacterium]|nr:SprT family zinc-dependent metalloprotease [Verrucomicrobiae bacterium]
MKEQFALTPGPLSWSGFDSKPDCLRVGSRDVRLWLVPNHRARRYVLRLRPDGSARVTIPRGGSAVEARRFAHSNISWIDKHLPRANPESSQSSAWPAGRQILFRGELVTLESESNVEANLIRFAGEVVRVKNPGGDLRPEIECHLWQMAARELPLRVLELAAANGLTFGRVSVRNQRSRWGSCSRRGTVSLNWRLVQAPLHVRDYIILHELAHLLEMNHSRRFWREVARLCPSFEQAEKWLKQNAKLLRRCH